MRFLLDHHIS